MRLLTLLAVGALALAACGGADHQRSDADRVRDTLGAFGDASARRDYRRVCSELLAKPVIESVGRAGLTCENAMKTALEGVDAPKVEVRKVTVNGNRASATVHTTASNQPASDDTTERKRPRRAPPGRSGASVVDCLARSHPSDHSSG